MLDLVTFVVLQYISVGIQLASSFVNANYLILTITYLSSCGNLHSMPRGETRAFYCDPPLVGEYITINIPKSNQVLALCEVEVYASELASMFYYLTIS